MIQSLSHIQRSRKLSQDFDDYIERQSRSSIHSSSSDIISPHYDYAHQHEAKLLAYQQNQLNQLNQNINPNNTNRQIPIHFQPTQIPPTDANNNNNNYEDIMHNAHSGPNQPPIQQHHQAIQTVIQTNKTIQQMTTDINQNNINHKLKHKQTKRKNHFQYPIKPSKYSHMKPPVSSNENVIIGQNKLIGNLNANAMKQVDLNQEHADLSDGNASFMDLMDEMSSDSDLEDDEKIQYNQTMRMISGNNTTAYKHIQHKHNKMQNNNMHTSQHPQLIHQLPKVPKPRILNLNVHRQRQNNYNNYKKHPMFNLYQNQLNQLAANKNKNEPQPQPQIATNESSDTNQTINSADLFLNLNRYDRRDSNESAMSSSMNSSVCTPHRRDEDDFNNSHDFFEKQMIISQQLNTNEQLSNRSMGGAAISQQSNITGVTNISNTSRMSGLMTMTMQSLQSQTSIHSLGSTIHINIKIFDPSEQDNICTSEIWMNIKSNDTTNDVIAAVIHQYQQGGKALAGHKVQDYELRYYDVDDDEIDEDFPPLGRNESVASKGIDAVAMRFIGSTDGVEIKQTTHAAIPDIDWDYIEYEVKDEYSGAKNKCILGIGHDRIHIVLKSNKTDSNKKNNNINPTSPANSDSLHRRMSTNNNNNMSMTGSLMPHFTYVFTLPNTRPKNLHHHRWIDARILTRQKNCRIKLHQNEEKQNEINQINEQRAKRQRQNAVTHNFNDNRNRSIATTFNNYQNNAIEANVPKLGLMLQTSVPTNNLLQNMQQLRLTPLRSGLLLDEYEDNMKENTHTQNTLTNISSGEAKSDGSNNNNNNTQTQPLPPAKVVAPKRRKSSAWTFNLFGLLNKKENNKPNNNKMPHVKSKVEDIPKTVLHYKGSASTHYSTDDEGIINYESWNTYNKDGKYFDRKEITSPSLRNGHYRSQSGSVASFRSSRNSYARRRSSVASILSCISIDNDEFTPLNIELCQKISVLKRDNTVFEINFLLDLSSTTPSINISNTGNVSNANISINSKEATPSSLQSFDETKAMKMNNHNHKYLAKRKNKQNKPQSQSQSHQICQTSSRRHSNETMKTVLSHTRSNSHTLSESREREHTTSRQSSTRSLSIQSGNMSMNQNEKTAKQQFQPYQADNIDIFTDISQSHSQSQSQSPSERSSSMELIDAGDYKPSNYKQHWNPTQIIPTLERISAAQTKQKHIISHPNSLVKQLVNKTKFHVFGNDKYLTHTVRYTAKSPEDCCQIVRKIQHLMLLENKAMDDAENNLKK